MIPYFVLALLPVIISFFGQKYRIYFGVYSLYETKTASIDVFMLIFFILLALRGLQCGNDTHQYLVLYEEYSSGPFLALFNDYDHEFGYKLLNKLVGVMANNYQVLIGVTSMMCVFPLWYFYKHESEHPLLTLAIFLSVAPFVMYFSGIRQAIAMALGIPSWYLAKNKRKALFILVVFIAIQFHTSAFMLLFLYPLYYAKITKKWILGVVPCMIAIYVFRVPIFNFLVKFLWQEYNMTPETGATMVLVLLVIFGIYSYIIPDEELMDNDTLAMRNILLLSIVLQCFAPVHTLAMRMNYYFLIFIPVLIPKIAMRSKNGFRGLSKLSIGIMTLYFLYYFLNTVITDNDPLNVFPYIPFWRN